MTPMTGIYTDRDAELGGLVVEPRQRELRHRDLVECFRISVEYLLFGIYTGHWRLICWSPFVLVNVFTDQWRLIYAS